MPADTILVIDAGTSAMRAVAVRRDGTATSIGRESWRMFSPPDASPFAREMAALDVTAALGNLLAAAEPLRDQVAGIAFTGQREGLVFADAENEALLISPNVDARAAAEGMSIDSADGERVYETTGHLPSLMQAAAKLAWLRAHRPQVAARVERVMPLADWLASRLTGEAAFSRTLGAENGLVDVASGEAAGELVASLAMSPSLVPPVVADGSSAGTVRQGVFAGLRVSLAGADTQCALAGLGAIDAGTAGIAAGWSAPVQAVTAAPLRDALRRTWTGLHVVAGRWVVESNAGDTGRAWDWACHLMGLSAEDGDTLAAASPAGSRDALSVLGPRRMNAAKMNAGVGAMTVPLPLVMTSPERSDVLRSVLEGVAFAIRANVEQVEAVSGSTIERIGLGGGMSRSALFARVVCDVLGRPVYTARSPETSALGAAIVASPQLGLHDTLERAVDVMAVGGQDIVPEMRVSASYDDVYERWCALADHLGSGRV